MSDVQKTWPNGAPEWRLRRWTARPASIGRHWIAGNERTVLIEDASDCHDLIRVLQEVHNEMCRREANPGTIDRKGWKP